MRKLPAVPLSLASVGGGVVAAVWISGVLWQRFYADLTHRYVDSGIPMLAEGDAYYHLYHAQRFLDGFSDVPLLSVLGALVSKFSGIHLQWTAFWLPMFIAALTGLCVWGWAVLLKMRPWQAALAAALSIGLPAYAARVNPGRFDTDAIIALLWHICLLATARTGLPGGTAIVRSNRLWGVMFFICGGLLAAFWLPGTLLMPLCIFVWGITFKWEADPKTRRVRMACALLVPLAGMAICFAPASLLPEFVVKLRSYAIEHIMLVLRLKDAQASIGELKSLYLGGTLRMLGHYFLAGLAICAALVLAVSREPKIFLFFIPSGLALALGIFSARFLYLAALPCAIGLVLLPQTMPWLAERLMPERRRKSSGLSLAAGLIVFGASASVLAFPLAMPEPEYSSGLDHMARLVRTRAVSGARLWNWWDEGYFLQSRAGLPPLFHGGSQSGENLLLASCPLASPDARASRLWMRFFAIHGLSVGARLHQAWGSWDAVCKNMSRVFASDDPVSIAAELPSVPGLNLADREYLMPAGQVFLFLRARFLSLGDLWMQYSPAAARDVDFNIVSTPKKLFQGRLSENQPGSITTSEGKMRVGDVVNTSRAPISTARIMAKEPPYLVTSDTSPWWHLVSRRMALSTAFRLLAPWGTPVPGFREVFFMPAGGGVWEVLP